MVEIMVDGEYLVFGSRSGTQTNRALESLSQSYVSDGQEISLKIRPSLDFPTSSGDFFSFTVSDGVEPVRLGISSLSKTVTVFENAEGKLFAYVGHWSDGEISVVDLNSTKPKKIRSLS
ncbi:MAG: hypothetical protein R3A11_02275 [Bdellovibrionota bacterium]